MKTVILTSAGFLPHSLRTVPALAKAGQGGGGRIAGAADSVALFPPCKGGTSRPYRGGHRHGTDAQQNPAGNRKISARPCAAHHRSRRPHFGGPDSRHCRRHGHSDIRAFGTNDFFREFGFVKRRLGLPHGALRMDAAA